MCCCQCQRAEPKRRFRPFALLFQLLLLYVLLVVTGGTLINTGHPVAVEVGRLLHLVTLVDPAIGWAHGCGLERVAEGLHALAGGVPLGPFT